jgi:hypothetical protein
MIDDPSTERSELAENERDRLYEEFEPTLGISIIWTILATVMTIGGFLLFLLIYAMLGSGSLSSSAFVDAGTEEGVVYFSVRFGNLLLITLLVFGVLVLHEAIHGVAFRYFGGRPTFGATMIQRVLPAFYCTAPGYWFTRGQFAIIILAPLVIITLLGIVLMPFVDDAILLVLPLAINLGGAIGDLWMAGMLLRSESGTMIEDHKDGLRFYPPGD